MKVQRHVIMLEASGAQYTAWTGISMPAQFGALDAHCPQGSELVGGLQGAAFD